MSMQAQIESLVTRAVDAVLGPFLARLVKLEDYIKALEQSDVVPADPKPRTTAAPESRPAAKASPAAGHGRPSTTAKTGTASGRGEAPKTGK
jgi:hypothetical protein